MSLQNMYRLRSAASFVMTAHSRQILSQKGKTVLKHVPIEIHPNLKRSWGILLFWPIHSCSLVRELALTLLWHPTFFQPFSKFCTPRRFLITITLIRLNQVSCVRMRRKYEKVIHNAKIASFLRLYWFWGQKFGFHRLFESVSTGIQQPGRCSKNRNF
jgi:hypothetical protein